MPSALENLCGPNRPLKAEVSDAREFAGLVRAAESRLNDAKNRALAWKADSIWRTTPRTDCVWPRFAGMATAPIIDTSSSRFCGILWASGPLSGVSLPGATTSATWVSTKAI